MLDTKAGADSKSKKQNLDSLKVPPYSIEAEQSVLGGIMLDNEAWDKVSDILTEEDFYRNDHKIIFKEVNKLVQQNMPFDVITLSDTLENHHLLEQVGGLAYLGSLAKETPSVANIAAYAEIVRERSVLRQLLKASNDIADRVYHPEGMSSDDILDEAEKKVFAIAEQGSKDEGPESIQKILPNVIDRLDELMESDGGITGLSSGFADLDEMTSGLQPADLVIVAGRPSMGKTTFAMNIAENAGIDSDKPVLVFSMEMPSESLAVRMFASLGRIEQTSLRNGQLKDEDWHKITSTMSIVSSKMNMYIDDTPALSPAELRSRARRVARENNGIGLIVVDYLQLMQVPGHSENRTNEVSEISRSLKALAKELNVPVIALSQLSRKVDDRNDKRPVMSDLRESGAIEQDADLIMFVYRDEVYRPDSEDKGTAEIIISKQRNGPIGMVRLTFSGQWSRFDNYTPMQV